MTRAMADPDVRHQVTNIVKDLTSRSWAQRLDARLIVTADLAAAVASASPPLRIQAQDWQRRAGLIRDRLSQAPAERLALRKHLERIADETAQLQWEMDHYLEKRSAAG